MIRVRRRWLELLSIAIGLLFTAAVYQTMRHNPRWDWSAPGVGQLPRDVVAGFMREAYDGGRGGTASRDYFARDAKDNAADAADRSDGAPIPHGIRAVVGQGATVIVFHRIGASRGQPQTDVIDRFDIKDGRIARRERFVTRFDDAAGEGTE
jgi:hypothetical protein